MTATNVPLTPITDDDREQFILDNQYAFKFGAVEEFGMRDDHLDGDGEIISRRTIEHCIDHGVAYRIREDGKIVGGLILKIDEQTQRGELEILFVSPDVHSKGVGSAAWQQVERLYPDTVVWETCTPYFEKRNIHFYVNKLGFHIVEFFCEYHRDPLEDERCGPQEDAYPEDGEGPDEMFRFVKYMK